MAACDPGSRGTFVILLVIPVCVIFLVVVYTLGLVRAGAFLEVVRVVSVATLLVEEFRDVLKRGVGGVFSLHIN